MSIGITKNGNAYKKSNSGKVVAATIGAVGGGYLANKNAQLIKETINDIYVQTAKQAGSGAVQTVKDLFAGKIDFSKVKADSQITKNVVKYGTKLLNAVKNHPVAAGAITGALLLLGIGAVVDDNANYYREKAADKK